MSKMICNKIWLISDLHFGVRSNALEWLTMQKEYYTEWFIPILKKQVQPNDVLFILGDIIDSRQSINILVLNTVLEIFEEISKVIPIYIILGNHDVYRKNSNDVNSTKIFQYINNIKVYQEPEIISVTNIKETKKILLMPWRKDAEEEIKTINELNNNCDYLFCHTDVRGIRYNLIRTVEFGNELAIFQNFKKVFSGHIHYRQESKNLIMVGCPYELTRSDMNNKKGIYIFDPFKNEYVFIENNFSPKFLRFNIDELLEMPLGKFNNLIKNNFIDVAVNIKWSLDFQFTLLMDNISNFRKFNIFSELDNELNTMYDDNTSSDLSNFNVNKLTEIYVENLNYSPKIKTLVTKKINELYDRVISGNINE